MTESSQTALGGNRIDTSFDVNELRARFPILAKRIRGNPFIYLDNAATTQKPQSVIDVLNEYYTDQNANIHRGIHYLSEQATEAYEEARCRVARFINAPSERQVIFVRGTTEGINLVAQTFGRQRIRSGDEILISTLEHHSNIVPWQLVAEAVGAVIKVIPMDDRGVLDLEAHRKFLNERTRIVALSHVSNAIGTVVPIAEMCREARQKGIPVVVDGAQSAPHMKVDVQALDCDFFVFSGHKVFAPTGIGVLYGKDKWLREMPPYQGGGGMIQSVTFEKTRYLEYPGRFEAGTPHIAGSIGLSAALDFMEEIGLDKIAAYEQAILHYATEQFSGIDGLRIIGTAPQKAAVLSFVLNDVHPHDISTFLDQDGIAIRAGHHCAQPLMNRLGLSGTARASFSIYNTREEVDKVAESLRKIVRFFKR